MNWDRLVRVAAPAVAPLDRDAAKAHLGVTFADDDDLIDGLIAAAVATVDGPNGIGVAMVEQTWRLSLDSFYPVAGSAAPPSCFVPLPGVAARAIALPLGPVREIVSIKYVAGDGSEQTLDPADYVLDADQSPALVFPAWGKVWPLARYQPGAVKIEFKAGFGAEPSDVPADLVAALKLILGHLYLNREAVIADNRAVVVTLPMGADAILDRYRVLPIA